MVMGGVPWLDNFKPIPKERGTPQQPLMVFQLMDEDRKRWDLEKLRELFEEETMKAITKIPLLMRNKPEKLIWVAHPQGKFTVRSAYYLQQGVMTSVERIVWKKLWGMKLHERLKMFMWRVAQNILPTRCRLQEMG